ncbi:hypothetical protein QKW60_12725 [Defluviimonas aestuarii]|uniref:hypothetical protein n=1 Tax=Albidovulum aestuarii TaxID=1130726 RepID=UPI00249CC504|nr:hypothetical protein [Defluviimonas aestuarii]MDI3337275.1 hypothetical protein [Defluviimonas aestuarii]
MKFLAIAFLMLPSIGFAADLVFDCGTPDEAAPEMGAQLIQFDGQDKGTIRIGGSEKEAMVLRGLDTLTFLHVGKGFTMQYAVHTEEGFYDYSASGTMRGDKRGDCVKTAG